LDVGGKNSHRLSPIYYTSIADIKTFRFRLKRSFPPQRNHENAQSFLPLQHILQYCRPGLKKEMGIGCDYTQGSQSTLIAPQVELPQSWMNF
jgi:hypothetical protein